MLERLARQDVDAYIIESDGCPIGYLQAVVQLACQRPDLGPAFREWLADFVDSQLTSGKERSG